jgi:hypothetical protein
LRRAPALAGALVLSTALSTAAYAASAINPSNRPTPVPNRTNGNLLAQDLVTVEPGTCTAYRPAATSLGLMLEAARHEGVDLRSEECYRPLDGQVSERQQWGPCAAKPGTSQHGWGKAIDAADARGGLTFTSPAYRWLKANAAAYGWNHPGWAEPGGSGCDEPWHWEWVGDGGAQGGDPIKADVVGVMSAPTGGWWSVTGLGLVTAGGGAAGHGGVEDVTISRLIVGGAATPDGGGYWLVAADGGVFALGNAVFPGSMGGHPLNRPIVGMAATPTGGGYWLVASDGGIFAFGDAGFFKSMGGTPLNRPVVGMASSPTGLGYWMVASDGGIFAFGDAGFYKSMGGTPINRPMVGMAPTPSGHGYWTVGSDGGVFSFGDAAFKGSLGGTATAPVTGMAASGGGYRIVAANGAVTTF